MTEATASRPTPVRARFALPDGFSWAWVGVMPFFLFALMFLILPTGFHVVGAFQDNEGRFTLQNLVNLFQPSILNAYWISIKVSAVSAVVGAIFFSASFSAIS